VTTLYRSLSRSLLLCLLTSSNSACSSVFGLMFSQTRCHLTLISYSSAFSGLLYLLTGNGSWSWLHSLGTDRTENAASNSFSVVACVSAAAITWRLLSHCLTTGVFIRLFPSNGSLRWLHNSGFQQTCHNTLYISLLLTEFIKFVRNEIFHVQCTTQRRHTVLQIDWQV
jgi:hypothetical protein